MYSYLTDDDYVKRKRKAKGAKTCIMKCEIKYEDYIMCLEENKAILKSQQRFRSEAHNVFTEKVKKIAMNTSDDKRLQA